MSAAGGPAGRRVLAVRLDSDGDVLLTGPAVAALRTGPDGVPAQRVDLLASPAGAGAARLLPGVDDVLVHAAPWSGYRPAPLDPVATAALVEQLRARGYDEAVVFTSFHQSPLPMALLARMAGIARVAGTSEDYPGSLLDVRHRRPGGADGSGGGHEVPTALAEGVCAGTGARDASGRTDLPGLAALLSGAAAVVVGNTGPAHLAAAVGAPVVSLFSPVVPADRWAPWGVPSVLLGDSSAPCAMTRARDCPVPGHPCLDVDPAAVVAAVASLTGVHPRAAARQPEGAR